MKYMVVSQPKSGTYLLANLLQSMNLKFSHIHVDEEDRYRIYKQNDLNNFEEYFFPNKNIENILQDNSFAVSHLECNEKNIKALFGMKKILITRDLDSIKKSAKMFFEETGRDVSELISKEKLIKMKKMVKTKRCF